VFKVFLSLHWRL